MRFQELKGSSRFFTFLSLPFPTFFLRLPVASVVSFQVPFKGGEAGIRLSYAFNYSGVPISPSDGAVSSGADKKWYLYRVSDMKKFIIKHIGGTPLKGSTANSFKGKKGVIVFNDCNWSDATGHVDLFNGIQCEYEEANDYFNNCNSELLYTLK